MSSEPPPIDLLNKKRKAAEILEKHACDLPYESTDLQLIDGFVYEPTWSTVMSDDLLGRMFPKLGPTEVVHFTKPDIFPSILEKKQLWLATVAKNFDAEYIAFLKEHAYAAAKSKQIRRELAECYFYASFTVPGSGSEPSHWCTFAKGGTGYRLRLQLSPRAADLREIRYDGSKKSLLTLLDEDLMEAIGCRFFPRSAAKLTAFSLRKSLAYEHETRLLVPNPVAPDRFIHNSDEYIALGIGSVGPWCDIELLAITCGRPEDVAAARKLADASGFSGISIDAR